MIKDFYICLDNTALNYALKHFSNPFTRIMRCYTGRLSKLWNQIKAKIFIRSGQCKIRY